MFGEGVRSCEPEFRPDKPGTEESASIKGLNGSSELAAAAAGIEALAAAAPAEAGAALGCGAGRSEALALPAVIAGQPLGA